MQVTVRFFTVLREITDKKQETLEFQQNEKVTILKILNTLSNTYGANFKDYVFDKQTGKTKGFLQFFINGQSSTALNGIETELKDGDMLAIIPPVGGG
jgi:molybdopterin synthase sulfur carrier subunit